MIRSFQQESVPVGCTVRQPCPELSERRRQDQGDNRRTYFIDSPTQPRHPQMPSIEADRRVKPRCSLNTELELFSSGIWGYLDLAISCQADTQDTILGNFPWVRLLADS
ncbi:MAG: hypothetical protein ACYTXA_24895 [Nostoc sp.]